MELTIEAASGSYGKVTIDWVIAGKNCEVTVKDGRGVESKVLVSKDAIKSLANALKG
jgi:hypothetical protein